MRIIHRAFDTLGCSTILIGRVGENHVTRLDIDVSGELAKYPQSVFEIMLKTPSFDEPYPLLVTLDGNSLYYDFSSSDLQSDGFGELEVLLCSPDGNVLKSATTRVRIDPSIITGRYPGPIEKILAELRAMIKELEVSGIKTVETLPDDQENDEIVYLVDDGLFRYNGESWIQLTDDNSELDIDDLKRDSHTHENKGVLDKLTESEYPTGTGTLKYNGVPVGIPVANSLPNPNLGYTLAYETIHNTLYRMDDPPIPVASAEAVEAIPDLIDKKHMHGNKLVLDTLTSAKIADYDDAVTKKHNHGNKPTIDKFSESGGKLLFDGTVVGNDVAVEDTPSDFEDGDIGIALFDGESHLVYPRQDDAETVYVNVAGKRLKIGVPAFREDAIDDAIAVAALPSFVLECANEAAVQGDIIPVVADITDNEYVDAGMELSADSTIIATSATKKYAIQLQLTVNGFQAIRPEKIIEVDATHVSVPALAFCMFEGLTGTFVGAGEYTVTEGWNVVYLTLDRTTYEVTGVDVITNADVNDYVFFIPSENNRMTVYSTSGSKLFKNTIDCDCGENSKGVYVKQSVWQNINDAQDVVPLELSTTYQNLVIRDDVSDDSIQDVPIYCYKDITNGGELIRLYDVNDNYIALGEVRQLLDGMPIRYINAAFNSSIKTWMPVPEYDSDNVMRHPSGWSENGISTTAPSFVNFAPVKVEYEGISYYGGDMPYEVVTALNSLSQCINVSRDAMGHINVPDDAIVRFNGRIESNRKYFFSVNLDFLLTLPIVDFSKYDEQFVMYLHCSSNVDISFPSDTLFANVPNSDNGYHKIIGSYSRGFGKWVIGGLDYGVQP